MSPDKDQGSETLREMVIIITALIIKFMECILYPPNFLKPVGVSTHLRLAEP